MASSRPPSILWLRRNLRIADNPPLVHAARESDRVIPVYIVSNWKGHHAWTGSKRQRFLCGALASLAANLGHIGGRLIIRQGDAVAELAKLAAETGAASIHYAFDPDPFGKSAEGRLARRMLPPRYPESRPPRHQPPPSG